LFEQTASSFRQVFRLDLVNPSRSDRWNFLPKCKERPEFAGQMAATMIGLEGTKHNIADPFWQESELLLLKAVLLHLPDLVDEPTPPMIFEYLALRDLKAIETEMLGSNNKHVKLAWGAFQKAPPQTQGSVITGLMNKLGTFQEENAQKICAPITEGDRAAGVRQIEFSRLREYGTVIYIVVAEGDATRYKSVLATFIGQAVNELRIDDQSQDVAPVGFVLDEAANVPLVGLKEIAGVGRGRRIGLILGYQNLPQVHDQYGQEGGNAILGSIGTTIFLPGLDDVTSQFASRRIGQTTVWSHTTVDGKGKKLDNERQSETGRALMDQSEVRQMVKHSQCVVVIDTSPPIKASYPPYAVLRQRAIAVDYGEPRLVSLIDAEEAFLRKVQAKMQTELRSADLMEDDSVGGDVLEPEKSVVKNDDDQTSSAISNKRVGKSNIDGRRRKEPKGEEDTEKDYAQRGLFETEVVQRELCNSAAAVYTDAITRVDEAVLGNGVGTGSQHNDSVR
jgi:type IV secretory pathway TraG/TraD family ATPase VirD4